MSNDSQYIDHQRIIYPISKTLKALGKAYSPLFARRVLVAYVGVWLGERNFDETTLLAAYQTLILPLNLVHFGGHRLARIPAKCLSMLRSGTLVGETIKRPMQVWLRIAPAFLDIKSDLVVIGLGVEGPSFWRVEPTLDGLKPERKQWRTIGARGRHSAKLLVNIGLKCVEVPRDLVLAVTIKDVNAAPILDIFSLNLIRIRRHAPRQRGSNPQRDDPNSMNTPGVGLECCMFRGVANAPGDFAIDRRGERNVTRHPIDLRRARAFLPAGPAVFRLRRDKARCHRACDMRFNPCRDAGPPTKVPRPHVVRCQKEFSFKTDAFRAGPFWRTLNGWNQHRRALGADQARAIRARQGRPRVASDKALELFNSGR